MEQLLVTVILAVFGAMFGSFAGASVWRLRAQQLVADKKEGEPVDPAELKTLRPLTKVTFRTDRSRCLHCGHPLAWYDLLPIVSWLQLGGKCRYCKAPIGAFELLMEIGVAAFFAASYFWWPWPLTDVLAMIRLVIWLLSGVGLAILFAYDAKWSLFDTRVLYGVVALAAVFAGIGIWQADDRMAALISQIYAVAILAGLYFALDKLSKGRWVGNGDAKLGLALAFLVGKWELAFLTLFAANLLGTLVVLPGLASGKLSRTARVPFGPFLIAGMVVGFFVGPAIVQWYSHLILW